MKLLKITILFTFLTSIIYSQESQNETISLETQFDDIYRTSTSYQNYKVISKDKFQKLKQDVLDSIKASQKLISEKERLLKTERENIEKIQKDLSKTQFDLKTSTNKENSISLFGLQLNKTTYNLILWGLVFILTLTLLYFAYKFSKSNVITKEAQNNLLEIEQEYELHRKKSLEKEQKLRRQLQDEINKQRNN
ncbi:hypothetical protein FDT66_09610 [Polaribacter aestuariivivens]|uniref:tRNA (Guanine-N1)-methyltransferase n=1 Tax=Polaribacter aestuariivivens TaxID=2304626 RepID=A0A5S3N4K8_9FLAO|nr:hypothetical protein [Polaribacter aestuariivivens]TMM29374.1 hypothetical protein FDT66_09610 [Polaribacter aestuariivivens]